MDFRRRAIRQRQNASDVSPRHSVGQSTSDLVLTAMFQSAPKKR
jgi:hypothetical protein